MPLVKLRTTFAHPVYGCAGAGRVIDVDEKTAKELIDGNYAERAGGIETAAMKQKETATRKKPDAKTG